MPPLLLRSVSSTDIFSALCFSGRVAQKRVIFYSWNYDPYGDDELTKRKHLEVVAKRLAKIETDIHFTAVLIGHPLGAKPNEYWVSDVR